MGLRRSTTQGIVRVIPAGVFALAAIGKTLEFGAFEGFLRGWLGVSSTFAQALGIGIIVAELAIVLLLASATLHRAGLVLGALVSLGFLGVTFALLVSGQRTTCPCFGALPNVPLPAMAAVDVGLVLLCGAGFLLCTSAPGGVTEVAPDPVRPFAKAFGTPWVWLSIPVCVCLIGSALTTGTRQRRAFLQQMAADSRPGLQFGQTAPPFALASLLSDRIVSLDALKGRWAIVCLVRLGCVPCEQEIEALEEAATEWGERVRIVLVFRGGSGLQQVETLVRPLRHRQELTAAIDGDRAVERRYGDAPMRWPTTVLLDPQGLVRYVRAGHVTGTNSNMTDLDHWLASPIRAPGTQDQGGTPDAMLDTTIVLHGVKTSLRQMSRDRPVVVSFMQSGCDACVARSHLLDRSAPLLADVWDLRIHATEPGDQDAEDPRPERRAVVADTTRALSKAFNVRSVPMSFILVRGRAPLMIGPEASEAEFVYRISELCQPRSAGDQAVGAADRRAHDERLAGEASRQEEDTYP